MKQKTCDIGARNIPVVMEDRSGKPAKSTLRWFCGGHGGVTRGYAFWSVLAGPVPLMVFRVASGRPIENELKHGDEMTPRQVDLLQRFADRVVPSTPDEVNRWLRSHPEHAASLVVAESAS